DLVVRTMTINCKRIEQVAFSTAYFQAGQQVLATISAGTATNTGSLDFNGRAATPCWLRPSSLADAKASPPCLNCAN
ncbi:hypothetical protein ABZ585_41995, partial [Streptomyces vietnamensis]